MKELWKDLTTLMEMLCQTLYFTGFIWHQDPFVVIEVPFLDIRLWGNSRENVMNGLADHLRQRIPKFEPKIEAIDRIRFNLYGAPMWRLWWWGWRTKIRLFLSRLRYQMWY